MSPTYGINSLPDTDWQEFVKATPTRMCRVAGPCTIYTLEGPLDMPTGWEGWLAIDSKGHPYPIDAEVQASTYRPADADQRIEAQQYDGAPSFEFPMDWSFGEVLHSAVHQYGGYCTMASTGHRIAAATQLIDLIAWRSTLAASLADGPLYAVLVEHNGHEGETWRHYIPVEGNEEAIAELAAAVHAASGVNDDDDIEFDFEAAIQENYVNDRISMGDSGYLDAHTKLAGKLQPLPEEPEGWESGDAYADGPPWVFEVLYKGKIRDLMEAT
jgi:hypothetical protein